MRKQRLSATVDSDLIEAVGKAAERGRFDSVSAWVNDAIRLKLDHESRLEALAAFVQSYEDVHGEITPDEMQLAVRRARSGAIVVRGARKERLRPEQPRRKR
jgi:Arc/MetJ-type ribon-helix-helix transcriptional regulator